MKIQRTEEISGGLMVRTLLSLQEAQVQSLKGN